MSTAFHPQTDGQTERTIRTVEEMMRGFTENRHHGWDKYLVAAEFQYNNSVHTAHGYTPFYLDTGQHSYDPHASIFAKHMDKLYKDHMILEHNINEYSQASEFLTEWEEALQLAQMKLIEAAESMTRQESSKTKPKQFEEGDQVWLDTSCLKLPNVRGKLAPPTKFDKRRFGPYKILRVLSNGRAYELELPSNQHFHPVQPVSRLEPVLESDIFPDAHKEIPPLPVIKDSGQEFEVDRILNFRMDGNRKKYLVRFKGHSEKADEWLPLSNLRNAMEKIQEYHNENDPIISTLYFMRT